MLCDTWRAFSDRVSNIIQRNTRPFSIDLRNLSILTQQPTVYSDDGEKITTSIFNVIFAKIGSWFLISRQKIALYIFYLS